MGNTYNSSSCTLTEEELSKCMKSTVFSADEIKALWFHFKRITPSQDHINRT